MVTLIVIEFLMVRDMVTLIVIVIVMVRGMATLIVIVIVMVRGTVTLIVIEFLMVRDMVTLIVIKIVMGSANHGVSRQSKRMLKNDLVFFYLFPLGLLVCGKNCEPAYFKTIEIISKCL